MKLWIGMLCAVLLLAPGNRETPRSRGAGFPSGPRKGKTCRRLSNGGFLGGEGLWRGPDGAGQRSCEMLCQGELFSFEEVLATWTEKPAQGVWIPGGIQPCCY